MPLPPRYLCPHGRISELYILKTSPPIRCRILVFHWFIFDTIHLSFIGGKCEEVNIEIGGSERLSRSRLKPRAGLTLIIRLYSSMSYNDAGVYVRDPHTWDPGFGYLPGRAWLSVARTPDLLCEKNCTEWGREMEAQMTNLIRRMDFMCVLPLLNGSTRVAPMNDELNISHTLAALFTTSIITSCKSQWRLGPYTLLLEESFLKEACYVGSPESQ